MASLRDLLPLVNPHVTGAPEPLVLQNLRLSAIDWCERTRCWRHVVEQVLTVAEPTIVLPSYAVLHEIEQASINDVKIEPVVYADVIPDNLDTGTRMWALTQKEPGTITILSFTAPVAPETDVGTLKLSMWLKPRLGNNYAVVSGKYVDGLDEIPQHIIDNHAERIVDGALARLLSMNETWGNPGLAGYRAGLVEEKAPAAKAKAHKGQHRARLRSKTLWM